MTRLIGIGGVFIDDIVLPSGQTYMAQLGGGVVHALMGATMWDERPGLVALIGNDLPDESRAFLEKHLDTGGLHTLPIRQARAWQLFEEDGSRRELYRTSDAAAFITGAQPEHLPDPYREDNAYYYLLQGFEGMRSWCTEINGFVFWEPLQQIMIPGCREQVAEVLQCCKIDVISPNLLEARAVYGELPPDDLITAFFDDGARRVALRMGANGSLIADKLTGEKHFMMAAPVPQIIDQTGAGNTYCGALLLGLMRKKSLQEAAAMAAVSASFCLEGIGVLAPNRVDPVERDRRYYYALMK